MAKEPKAVPTIGTKEYFSFTVNGERAAKTAAQSTNEERAEAARAVYRGAAAWFGTDKSATADDALALYYTAEDMPKGDTLNSRKREWNNILEAARADMEKAMAIWPAKEEGKRSITRKLYLEGCTMVHKAPSLSSAAILEKLRAKKAPVTANAGDLLASMFGAEGTMMELFKRYPAELAPMLDGLNAARGVWAEARSKGGYLTTEETMKAASAIIVPLEIPKAA